MKRIITLTIILMTLTACATHQTQGTPESASTDLPQPNLPNPASVYCEQNGGALEKVAKEYGLDGFISKQLPGDSFIAVLDQILFLPNNIQESQ
ncbi:MAG: DUF333 domain-containing protein [Anaerolineales bacterium]|nr:DUF333 domain-containing protein [Anaerolineales bacterium]